MLAQLQTDSAKADADLATLLANSTPGLQPGQVIVLQSDIDALTASVGSVTTSLQAILRPWPQTPRRPLPRLPLM